ncbi:unnamed protein product [Protopolystoma xenopodis]|uniref:Uncharacterized protein n=1 Tax=Protopolystoma xenopodis TaxID=117903 RepID=A0A3S5A8X6_9PLAT|nr:unnamed protein product [Protopolystoma xenopodis]
MREKVRDINLTSADREAAARQRSGQLECQLAEARASIGKMQEELARQSQMLDQLRQHPHHLHHLQQQQQPLTSQQLLSQKPLLASVEANGLRSEAPGGPPLGLAIGCEMTEASVLSVSPEPTPNLARPKKPPRKTSSASQAGEIVFASAQKIPPKRHLYLHCAKYDLQNPGCLA